ncbi:MAG: osmosensitive channel signal transduction histidine kinase [Actinobacteria bacterium]|nr:osmosensitive channel signal transduction histidine kinase [Actinomycetota bacterium]
MAFVAGTITGTRGRMPPRLARLTIRRPRRRLAGYLVATVGTAALTAALLPFRNGLAPLSKGFGYLVIVVAAAAIGGLGPGILASLLSFLTFNFFFLPPYNSFIIGSGEDIVVLFVFLGLSILISAALARASERAEAAEAREAGLAGLQELSALLVALGAGDGSYDAVLARVGALFGFSSVTLALDEASGPLGDPGMEMALSVGGRSLGRLTLRGERPPLSDAEGRVLRAFSDQLAVVAERDRLSKAAMEAQVYRETDHLRRSLLAAVSHDLRSPLAAIKASVTDLLGEDAEHSPDDLREALESVNDETDRLASMIANLLDMSRIEGGILRARVQGVDLGEVLSECVDRALRRWPGLSISLNVDDDAAGVRADPLFLDRVVANLLENAAKAATESGTRGIEVEAHRDPDDATVVVAVIDHGRGVAPELRRDLFVAFYQVDRRNSHVGTGLGLAICKGFLALMSGAIWVDETVGGGATFRFSLPLAVGSLTGGSLSA